MTNEAKNGTTNAAGTQIKITALQALEAYSEAERIEDRPLPAGARILLDTLRRDDDLEEILNALTPAALLQAEVAMCTLIGTLDGNPNLDTEGLDQVIWRIREAYDSHRHLAPETARCPRCWERRTDLLIATDEGGCICQTCGKLYSLDT